jgi:hypothetical protein
MGIRDARLVILFWALCISSMLGGCFSGSGRKPIDPGTGIVTISVWRVLAPGDALDSRSNRGCRLFASEISGIVNDLIANAHMFGGNTSFSWNHQIRDQFNDGHDDPGYLAFGGLSNSRTYKPSLIDDYAYFEYLFKPNNGWHENRVNIYFVGDVQWPGVTPADPPLFAAERWAATRDPADHLITLGIRRLRWTYINDGSFLNNDGDPFPVGGPPRFTEILASHAIQHEATHYLARFDSKCFTDPTGTRCYEPEEHIIGGGNNILRPSVAAGQSLPLVIPGGIATPGTEKAEVFGRVIAGTWNNP